MGQLMHDVSRIVASLPRNIECNLLEKSVIECNCTAIRIIQEAILELYRADSTRFKCN